jgi:light-regulated signal transduction histidine kinase (bacteriophytochrome)
MPPIGTSLIEPVPGLPAWRSGGPAESRDGPTTALLRKIDDLEQFAQRAAHDLQEPLRMVTGYTQLLEERYGGTLEPKAAEFLGLALEGARRMQDLVDGILLLACADPKADPRRMTLPAEAVAGALANLRLGVEESYAAIRLGELRPVWADPAQLMRMFQNLIGNSIRYRAAARPLEISVECEERARDWLFQVVDNGKGFAGRHALGLGLKICRRIAEGHGGRLWMRSPGAGATVCFTLAKI